jgi:transcriptional regulator with XRE-family HTH domain
LQPVPLRLKGPKPREDDFEPQTLGEHILKRRRALGVDQRRAAARLGVTIATVSNWEGGRAFPAIDSIPAVLEFLGYDPFPEPNTVAERLLAKRRAHGWSIREAAALLAVDPGTWGDWEHGAPILYRGHRRLVAKLLSLSIGELDHNSMG